MIINSDPAVSVIIPALNEADHIGILLEELQAYAEIEIIVCDGGSTDRTRQICSAYPVQICSGAAGRGKQMNMGVQAAASDILLFLHADTRITAGLIPQVINAVRQGNMWGCARLSFDDPAYFFRWLAFMSNWRARYLSSCYGDQAIFCQKEFFYETAMFPETKFLEDIAFSHKARKRQKALVLSAQVVTSSRRFRQGGRWRMLFKMQFIKLLYFMGVSPERLSKMYG